MLQFENNVKLTSLDRDGRILSEETAKNQLTYAAATALINGVLQSGPSQVSWLYARFGPATPTAYLTNSDLRTVTRNDFIAPASNAGGLWVPLMSPPAQSSSQIGTYIGNVANYQFRIPYNPTSAQVSPYDNFNVSTSYIYALGIAVAPSVTDRTQDIIVAFLQGTFAPFPIPPGGQEAIGYPWTILVNLAS